MKVPFAAILVPALLVPMLLDAQSRAAQPGPASGAAAPLFEQPVAGTPNFTGKWLNSTPGEALHTTGGGTPPLNTAGRAEYTRRSAALKSGDHKIDPVSTCLMHGIPRLLYAPFPFLILQTTRNVSFVHEVNHTFRIVYWDKPPPEDADPTYLGSASAHMDGKTLVITSSGFNDLTWLDYSGLPHGEKLRVQERYALADSQTIKVTITVTDPDFYTAPWTTGFTLKRQPGMQLKENVCMDTHQM